MSSRRLVNRGRANQDSSPVQHSRHRDAEAAQEPTPLPPYEPPTCTLTPTAQRALENLRVNHNYSKYKKHLDGSIKVITNSIGDSNERLRIRKDRLAKAASKRREGEEEENGEELSNKNAVIRGMENKVASLTAKADKALRDLIDYGDELSMQDSIMKEISENIAAAPAPSAVTRRQRRRGSSDDENAEDEEVDLEEEEELEVEGSRVSAVELLKKAQEEYAAQYAAKSMRLRYDTNYYRSFKKTVHICLNGEDVPVPAPRTWFAEDHQNDAPRDGSNDVESDDDVVIERATINLKCLLTLQVFKEPFSNEKCKHVFEKAAILEYIDQNGTIFAPQSQPRRGQRPVGPKQVKCPQVGCDAMLQAEDFQIDNVLLRQIKQAARQAARDLEDDDDDDPAPPGTQRNRPAEVNEDEDSANVDEEQLQTIARVKRERHESRGQSMAPERARSPSSGSDEIEAMDTE